MAKETAKTMLDDLRSAMRAKSGGVKLTEWEEGFIEDVGAIIDMHGRLTPNQLEKLEQIWDKI